MNSRQLLSAHVYSRLTATVTASAAQQYGRKSFYTITLILDPSNLSQTPDISSRLSNQFVLYIVNLRQIYPKPLFYPQIPNDRSEYKIEVMVYLHSKALKTFEKES